MNWYIEVLKKYTEFSGRARRKEYWFFTLFNILFSIIFGVIDAIAGTINLETGVGMIGLIYMLLVLIPSTAVLVRRLHDTGRSAWWLLLLLIPVFGVLVMLVFMVLDSDEGDNQYGANPKDEVA